MNNTYYVATKFYGDTYPSLRRCTDLLQAVERYNERRHRKGVERVLVSTDPSLNSGVILDSASAA